MTKRVWTCHGCGKTDHWSEGWSYYGNFEGDQIQFVACSAACMAKFEPPKQRGGKRGNPFKAAAAEVRQSAAALVETLKTVAEAVERGDIDTACQEIDFAQGALAELDGRVRGLARGEGEPE